MKFMPKGLQGFQKGHKRIRTKESYQKAGKKISERMKANFKEGKGHFFEKGNEICIGRIPWNKDRKDTPEQIEIKRQRAKGNKNCLGKHWKVEDTSKMKGHITTKETREKMKKFAEKNKIYKRFPDNRGENHPQWQGGKSFEPYGLKFNNQLKEQIRKRDNYTCQECGYTQEQLGYKLSTHHIDYDKQNNQENNLISLCKGCHSQTNFERENWINYFRDKVKL